MITFDETKFDAITDRQHAARRAWDEAGPAEKDRYYREHQAAQQEQEDLVRDYHGRIAAVRATLSATERWRASVIAPSQGVTEHAYLARHADDPHGAIARHWGDYMADAPTVEADPDGAPWS